MPPPPQNEAGVWPFEDQPKGDSVRFIVGIDDEGNNVEYTSDPDQLCELLWPNPAAPHYLTSIYFRREVLGKYFAEPERYEVTDGLLSCSSLWSCRIDNDLAAHVVVFLGDLGRNLPYEERLRSRQFNVPPEGGVSETNFRRSFLAQFTDAVAPDLSFRREYEALASAWQAMQGWPLFLPLSTGDSHLLTTVRNPRHKLSGGV